MALGSGEVWPNRHLLVSGRLRERRDGLGLTQKQVVARLARLGVRTTNRALSSLEHGAGVDVARLPELADALDCTVTFLLGLTQNPHQWSPDSATDPGTGTQLENNGANGSESSDDDQSPALAQATGRVGTAPTNDRSGPDNHSWILGLHVPDRTLPLRQVPVPDETRPGEARR